MQGHGEDVAISVRPNCLCGKSKACDVYPTWFSKRLYIALVKNGLMCVPMLFCPLD